jgi:Bacterial tandem repeat domain 1
MKTYWLSMICVVLNLFNFQGNVLAQTVEVKNVTSRQYQKQFNELTQQGYRPIKVTSKTLQVIDYVGGEQPQLGYWATFQKQPNSPAWAAQHGLTSDAYQQSFNHWTAQGYLPTDINVAYLNGQASYSVIFDKVTTPVDWEARHGLDSRAFQQTNQTLTQQGFKLKIQANCKTSGSWITAALWVKEKVQPVAQPMTQPIQTKLRMKRNW